MNAIRVNRIGALSLIATIVFLSGCAGPASREAMTAPTVTVARKHPHTVSVEARGGAETDAMSSSNASNEDLKAAIESSIAQSALFNHVIQGKAGDYELTVTVSQLSKPFFGASFTVTMEAGWSLTKSSDKSIAMRKLISSSYTATFRDSLVGVTRLRLAVEGAARGNIEQGLQAIALLDLK